MSDRDEDRKLKPVRVPEVLEVATAWSWRLLIVGAAVLAIAYVAATLSLIVLALFLAFFFTALLRPISERLRAHGAPPFLAALVSILLMMVILAGIAALIVPRFVSELQELADDIVAGVESVGDWLVEGPAGISRQELDEFLSNLGRQLQDSSDQILGGVLTGAQFAVEVGTALVIAVVVAFFFLKDGDRLWDWVVGLFSQSKQDDVREMGSQAWGTLSGYLRGMTVVALADSIFIGMALVIFGVPGALALSVLIFFGAYIPIAGAIVTGAFAVLIALIAEGLVTALFILGAVVVVQQAESNLLHPFVVGRAVRVHPVAILLGVVAGAILGGVIGAFIAVPIVAVAARVGGYIREQTGAAQPAPDTEPSA